MANTKLNLKPGEKGRLTVQSNVKLDEASIQWSCPDNAVQFDTSKQRTPFDMLIVAAMVGFAYVEFRALDADGNNREHIFEIHVSEQDGDSDLIGSARVSRESIGETGLLGESLGVSSDTSDVASTGAIPEAPAVNETSTAAVDSVDVPNPAPALAEVAEDIKPVAEADGADAVAIDKANLPVATEDGAGNAPQGKAEPVNETTSAEVSTADEKSSVSGGNGDPEPRDHEAETIPSVDAGLMAGNADDAVNGAAEGDGGVNSQGPADEAPAAPEPTELGEAANSEGFEA